MKILLVLLVSCFAISASYHIKSHHQSYKRWDPKAYHQTPIYCYDSVTRQNELCEMRENDPDDPRNQRSLACFAVFNDEGIFKAGCWEQQHLSLNLCSDSCNPSKPHAEDFCCCFEDHCNSPIGP